MAQRPRGERPAQRKVAQMRQREHARQVRFRILSGIVLLAGVAVLAVVLASVIGNRTQTVRGTVRGMAQGATVDGIACSAGEQVAYHIHAHLAIFVNGHTEVVPRGIGIPGPEQVQSGFVVGGKCYYWLHTHDNTGIIHIESPTKRLYTLGQFFDIWGQPLSNHQVGSATGVVTVFVNGHRYSGDPRSITLTPHEVIQLDVGTVVPPRPFTFPPGY